MAESKKFVGTVTNEQVVAAIRAQHEATVRAKSTLAQMVSVARNRGISWTVIGEALGGITKQSAQRKYAPSIKADREAEERKVAELLGLTDEEVNTLRTWGDSDRDKSSR
ncbi:hypothetical protein ACFTZB_29895 [Rhodococcus sp. NPDC057014]|uniref:hypothetical protein n=1 Tax=Rhodococcus sp. NPDC057014 TaxID=3346000 RepID=UPI003633361F